MATLTAEKVQISVRIDRRLVQRLDAQVRQARRSGRPVTKEKLVADAIAATYPESEPVDMPVHDGALLHGADRFSNVDLLDLVDRIEAGV
ncbi:MAG: hypothetical protein FWF36_04750 [Propionibacteriaceae bacterium]|nr:hypothetical protein [Propionibacteriaceae bacterium]